MKKLLLAAAAAIAIGGAGMPALADHHQAREALAAAVANPDRPEAQRALDEARKPAETLAFAEIGPGSRVVELVPGGGYFTRIISSAVGPEGHVYALQTAEIVAAFPQARGGLETLAGQSGNVTAMFDPVAAWTVPAPVDVVFTAQNYHDLYVDFMGPADVAAVNQAVFNALRPGGLYVILDHAAVDGSGQAAVSTLHRIDRQSVIDEVTAAGFELVGESDILRNAEDDRSLSVFDDSIRRRTDQFILKFRKPA
ncbi:methyltransferase [Brevundimonas sp. 2R-24]|uniref:Methyltransferase n=1 Tax=Peiella sedimenti TaxID=3061083 RepID=A0ABT8SKS6_9CAUL|nr:methyltransferase [Caulobacteraceae bacterium XZ-24]